MVALSRCPGSLALFLAGAEGARVSRKRDSSLVHTKFIAGEPCCSCHGGEATTETTLTTTTNSATETTLTTTTNAPTETTFTTTTNAPVVGPCKSWCASHTSSWDRKCRWQNCAGCSQCSARRLRGSGTSIV